MIVTDVLAFLMIAAVSYKSAYMFKASGLFGRVVQDATVYFLVIVWMHLTVTIYTSTMGEVSAGPPPSCFLSLGLISDVRFVRVALVTHSPSVPHYVSPMRPLSIA